MTKLDVSNSSTDSTSGSSSDSSSSGSSRSSSSSSSSSDSESSACEIVSGPTPAPADAAASATASAPAPPTSPRPVQRKQQPLQPKGDEANALKKKDEKPRRASARSKPDNDSTDDDVVPSKPAVVASTVLSSRRRSAAVPSKPKTTAAIAAKKPLPRVPTGGKAKPPPKPAPRPKETRGTPKKKSIFSPDNSSESENDDKPKNGVKPKPNPPPTKGKARARKASAGAEKAKPQPPPVEKKEEKNSVNNKENVKRRSGSRSSGPPAKVRPGDDKARPADDKARPSEDKRPTEEKNRPKADRLRSRDDRLRSGDDRLRSGDDRQKSGDEKLRSGDDKLRSGEDRLRSGDDRLRSGDDKRRSGDDKVSVYSCSSSRSSVDTDSPDTDSEPSPKKDPPVTRTKPPPSNKTPAKNNDGPGDSGDNVRIDAPEAALPRKLTRSLSARNMRMLACQSRTHHTDTDSDDNDKANDKGSGQGKRGRRPPAPTPRSPPVAPPEPKERRCPVRDCDSTGHLGGKLEKHFTWDACPLYHNVSGAWCVAAAEERAAASAVRRRAAAQMQQRPRTQPSLDQRAYQLKVKDLRSKWRGPSEARERWAAAAAAAAGTSGAAGAEGEDADREPILDGFAPEYDLKLFREAQAQAASKIEEELGDLPANRGTRFVVMGKYCMEVWYQSPYPGDAARLPRLYVCEYCLSHHKSQVGIARHTAKCAWRHPPGDEVYRKGGLCVWQVDGRKHKQYCQQLCLLAKFFLDHKTLYYDVEPFLFYVMTLADREGCHTVGYFSKEKNSFLNYNVSCILTLPPYQRQGYGRLLIDFSYLLTKTEGKVGSPEKPLSDLGLISYRSYWKDALLKRLCSASGSSLCIRDLSKDLAVASYDIVSTLQERGLMKYWKGKHIVLKKQEVLEEFSRKAERVRSVDPACLRWTPPVAPPPPR